MYVSTYYYICVSYCATDSIASTGIPSGASSATESSRDGWGRRPADDSTARAADFNSRNSRPDEGARRRHARHRFGDEAADVRDATAEIFSGLTDRDGGSEGTQFACSVCLLYWVKSVTGLKLLALLVKKYKPD